VRLVRDHVCAEVSCTIRTEVLREVLLSEMADDAGGCLGAGSLAGSGGEAREEEIGMVCVGVSGSACGTGEDNETQPIDEAGCQGEDFCHIESNEPRTIRAWGQWARDDISASIDAGCSWARLGGGISVITGPKEARIPNMLQARLRQSADENRNRGGWSMPLGAEEDCGPKAGCDDTFVRVDGIEVLEPGDCRLDELRDADGKLYFYDLGATRHPSYSVNGCLVHNSSILKSFTGSTTRSLINAFAGHRFRMAATATPAPNDHMELGTHAEYLGVMSSREMLSRWFINDASTASQSWRLKKHARESFWDWMSSWARMAGTPADLGFSDRGYVLPELVVHKHRIKNERYATDCGDLFGSAVSATSLFAAKRKTVHDRADMVAELVAAGAGAPWVVWCDTNQESAEICKRTAGAVEVKGADAAELKEERLAAFANGDARVIVTKPSICGFGLNWQHCHNVIFAGRTFSYEAYYQAVRRCWRFGQRNPVNVHLVMTSGEDEISRVIDRKAADHAGMKDEMASAMRRAIGSNATRFSVYTPDQKGRIPSWLTASDTPTETGSPHIKAIA